MRIERIHSLNSRFVGSGNLWQPQDCWYAGITDLFVKNSIPKHKKGSAWDELAEFVYYYYGEHFQNTTQLKFCEAWPEGIDLAEVLKQDYDPDVYYEIDCDTLIKWPDLAQVQQLCSEHNLLVFDYMELGGLVGKLLALDIKYRNTIYMDSGMGDHLNTENWHAYYDYVLPSNFRRLQVPLYLYFTSSMYQGNNFIPKGNTMEHDILANCFKPRDHRIKLLAELWRAGVLNRANWSLAGSVSKPLDVSKIEHTYWRSKLDLTAMEPRSAAFCKYHDRILPKRLQGEWFKDHSDLLVLKHTDYKWHIVMESFPDRVELTEKIWQAFMLQNPPLVYAGVGYGAKLRSLGFKIDTEDYEHTDIDEYIKRLIEKLNQEPDTTHLEYNQNLLLQNDHWAEYLVKALEGALIEKCP
jgi:hypothetical protein